MIKYITLKKHDLQELLETIQMFEEEKWIPIGDYTCKRTKESSEWETKTNGRTPVNTSHSSHYKGLFRSYSTSSSSSGGSYSSKEKGSGEINVEYTYEQVIKRECDFSWIKDIENGFPLDYYNYLSQSREGGNALNNKIRKIIFTNEGMLEDDLEPTIREGRVYIIEGFETPQLEKDFTWVLRIYDMDGNIIIDTLDVGIYLFEVFCNTRDSFVVIEPDSFKKKFNGGSLSILKEEHESFDKHNNEYPHYSILPRAGAIPMSYNWKGKVSGYYVLSEEIQHYYKNVRKLIGAKGNFEYKEVKNFMGMG